MFDKYPKKRGALPPEYEVIYARHYKENRLGLTKVSSLAKKMEAWMHRKVARDVAGATGTVPTLEIGAGPLNHLEFEKNTKPYDIVEPFRESFGSSPALSSVRNVYSDISEVPRGQIYARIISIATLEHVEDLPRMIASAGLLLREGGHLRAGIPSEGTLLWKLGWKLTTGREFKKRYGLDYGVIMRHDHINTAAEIEEVLQFFFRSVRCDVFGLARSFSFYRFYDCFMPEIGKCRAYLEKCAI